MARRQLPAPKPKMASPQPALKAPFCGFPLADLAQNLGQERPMAPSVRLAQQASQPMTPQIELPGPNSRLSFLIEPFIFEGEATSCTDRRGTRRKGESGGQTLDHQEVQRKEEGSPTELPRVYLVGPSWRSLDPSSLLPPQRTFSSRSTGSKISRRPGLDVAHA